VYALILNKKFLKAVLLFFYVVDTLPPARRMPQTMWNENMEHLAANIAGKSCSGKVENIQDITGDLTLTANIAASREKPEKVCSPIKFWSLGKKYYRFPKAELRITYHRKNACTDYVQKFEKIIGFPPKFG